MRTFRWSASLIAALIVVYQCFVPPIVGMADNADFLIIVQNFSLDVAQPYDPDRFFSWIDNRYYYSEEPTRVPAPLSSEVVIELPGFVLSNLVSKTGHYDIRWAGLSHAAIFLLAIYWIFTVMERMPRRRWLAAAITLFILTDVAYVAYFNSFYTDAASFVTLLALAACILRFEMNGEPGAKPVYFMAFFAVLFVTAKVQHAILGLPLAAYFFWRRESILKHAGRRGLALTIAPVLLGMALLAATTVPRYRAMALYNVVFHYLLPVTPEPVATLRELGLPETYIAHKGTHSFGPGSVVFDPNFQEQWIRQISFGTLLRYYARHPGIALRMLTKGVAASRVYRTDYGNFERTSGLPPQARSQAFALWSRWKEWQMKPHPYVHLLFSILPAAFLLVAMHSPRFRKLHAGRPVTYLFVTMALMALGVASLSDVLETSRHLFLYNAMQDFILVAAAVVLCYGIQAEATPRDEERTPAILSNAAARTGS